MVGLSFGQRHKTYQVMAIPPTSAHPTSQTHRFVHPEALQHPQRSFGYVVAAVRIALSGVFLWGFFDKLFGLGYATARENSWLNGGSPTSGFLNFGANGTLGNLFEPLAGQAWVDWIFMMGLLGIGLALLLGIGMRIAAISGVTLLMLMYAAVMPSANNPIIDDHLIYSLVLVALAMMNAGHVVGFGAQWQASAAVRRYPILK